VSDPSSNVVRKTGWPLLYLQNIKNAYLHVLRNLRCKFFLLLQQDIMHSEHNIIKQHELRRVIHPE